MSEYDTYIKVTRHFVENDIIEAANIIEGLELDEALVILQSLPSETAGKMIKNLQVSFAAGLLEGLEEQFLCQVLTQLEPHFLATLLMNTSKENRERLREHIKGSVEEQIRELLEYPQGSVGRVVTTNFLAFDKKLTAGAAIDKIRAISKKKRPTSYAYVVDDEKHLLGVLNMHDLMISDPDRKLETIMTVDVFSLHCFDEIQEAANALSKRKYFAAPVVDSQQRIIGVIKAERLIKGIQEESVQDLQRMFGAGGDEKPFSKLSFALKKRLFWLHINLVTAFMAALVVALFEGVIAKITILAVFLPVVAGQGGNAGAQSLAIVMRGIVMREIPKGQVSRLILKEGLLGVINGTVIGFVTAIVAWAWKGNPYLGVVIGLGMFFNLIFAGLAGASIPLVMKKIGVDPAQSANIILTTVTDILGFLAFLSFALIFQKFLI